MTLIDLLDVGITQILFVKKKKYLQSTIVKHNKTGYVRTFLTIFGLDPWTRMSFYFFQWYYVVFSVQIVYFFC